MWWWVVGVAHSATWTWRAPVPTQPLTDQEPLQVCLQLGADLGIEPTSTTTGNTTLECATVEQDDVRRTRMCYTVTQDDWPTEWPSVSCAGPRTTVQLRLIPAYDPLEDIEDGVTIFAGVDEVMATFIAGPEWPNQQAEGRRGSRCEVVDGRFIVTRDSSSRRKDSCRLDRRDGKIVDIDIRFTNRAP